MVETMVLPEEVIVVQEVVVPVETGVGAVADPLVTVAVEVGGPKPVMPLAVLQ